ncbi:29-kDa cytoplasmic protein [Babesia caballi]|uniref:29-kDa cytoplasmic protein n=1 Tax=Babesia caballi TaxID=5871 RepID=A0AAV4LWY1_BABCB|nr:29-kDa cytoplasmic protein [Babesia caballi]
MQCCTRDTRLLDEEIDTQDTQVRTVGTVADRSRAQEIGQNVERQWVAVTTYQPIDTITKTIEVPVVKTVERIVPKPVIQERVIQVPREVPQVVEKVVEIPDVKFVEKIIEVPQVQYRNKLVPKVEVVEKIVEKPQIIEQWTERKVEVPQIKEVVRYKEIDETEEIIRYYPKGHGNIDWDKECEKAHIVIPNEVTETKVVPKPQTAA